MTDQLLYKGKILFHISHIKNLPGILNRGILCKNEVNQNNIKFDDISENKIQEVRANKQIPGTSTNLHDYVPLFFGARPPMLWALRGKGIQQKDLIYVLVGWEILNLKTTWFTDGNASTHCTNFYCDTDDLENVNFDAVGAKYWGNRGEEYRRQKQAEVLCLKAIQIKQIKGFGVYDGEVKQRIIEMLSSYNVDLPVYKTRRFYY